MNNNIYIARIRIDADSTDTIGMAGRTFDIIVSSLALVFFSPIMLVIAFAILIESGGPILFSQVRLGRGGRHFRMYKFRKFHKECITDGTPLCVEQDTRLTALGKFLRSTKLDELPQLWNIIRGDMSIVEKWPRQLCRSSRSAT